MIQRLKDTKVSVFTLAIIAIILALAILLPIGFNSLFSVPTHVRDNLQEVLAHQNMVLSPHFFHINAGRGPLRPFNGRLHIRPGRFSITNPLPGNRDSATISYRFGRARFQDDDNHFGYEDLTLPQSVFWNAPRFAYWNDIVDDNHYIAWLGFDQPMDRHRMLAMFPTLFVGRVHSENYGVEFLEDFAISWFVMKTSDDPADIALGTHGNMNRSGVNMHVIDSYRLNEIEHCFFASLQFLYDNQRASDLIISSGFWAGAETIDFNERLWHFHSNRQYLGFVAHIRGYDLRNLYDTGVNIVRLIED